MSSIPRSSWVENYTYPHSVEENIKYTNFKTIDKIQIRRTIMRDVEKSNLLSTHWRKCFLLKYRNIYQIRQHRKRPESNEVENIWVIHLRYVYLFRIERNIIFLMSYNNTKFNSLLSLSSSCLGTFY